MKSDHGDSSKYIHVRLRPPSQFSKMRTADIGNSLKQVYGKVKGKDQWKPQNIMIPKNKVEQKGNKIVSRSKKLVSQLHQQGISISQIIHMKSRGSADYKHPAPPCPGSKIRSGGRGQGLGRGKGKGPIGRMR